MSSIVIDSFENTSYTTQSLRDDWIEYEVILEKERYYVVEKRNKYIEVHVADQLIPQKRIIGVDSRIFNLPDLPEEIYESQPIWHWMTTLENGELILLHQFVHLQNIWGDESYPEIVIEDILEWSGPIMVQRGLGHYVVCR